MKRSARPAPGFTLVELLTALLMLSLLALMSYRGLGAVLETRARVGDETAQWQRLAAFSARFEQDVQLAAPRPAGNAPAWRGRPPTAPGPLLEFSRSASMEGIDKPRRVAYALNDRQEIELWLWPGPEVAPDVPPARYAVLGGVLKLEFDYLNADLAWVGVWPASPRDAAIPRAVRMKVVRAGGGEIVRVFALDS